MIRAIISSMRPKQWTKNFFIFFALVFDKQLFHIPALLHTIAGFGIFCFISSSVYIINDIFDIEVDKQHPTKKNRPLPSGKLSVATAWASAGILVALSLAAAAFLELKLLYIVLGYLFLNLAYSKWLKHIAILDVFIIATGFILRVEAGVVLIVVERFSPWLYVVTTLGALYLGFGKRRAELSLLSSGAGSHRKVLDGYSIPLLDQYITIVSAATILSYSLYTFSAPNLPQNHSMMLTIPFVAYIIFRYLYLIQMTNHAGAPDEVLLSDRPIQISIAITAIVVLAIFYLQ
jgi:4-hydroxybenzoate polyprenyltransferase